MKATGPKKNSLKKKNTENQQQNVAFFKERIQQYFSGEFDVRINSQGKYEVHVPELDNKKEERLRDLLINEAIHKIYELIRPNNSVGLFPNEVAYTCPSAEFTILGTTSIDDDVVIVLHDIETHDSAMAYFTMLTDVKRSCEALIKKMGSKAKSSLDLTFVSTTIDGNPLLHNMLIALSKYDEKNIINKVSTVQSSMIAIDSENGMFYSNFEFQDLGFANSKSRSQRLAKNIADNLGNRILLMEAYDGITQKPSPVLFSSSAAKNSKIYQAPKVDNDTVESVRKAISSLALTPNELYEKSLQLRPKRTLRDY